MSKRNAICWTNIHTSITLNTQLIVKHSHHITIQAALRLFETFANAPGQIFSKAALVDRLFSFDDDVTENAIEVYVGRLRRHLETSSVQITTVRGLGYKLDT